MGKERGENPIVELPRGLSDLISDKVRAFIKGFNNQGLKVHSQYQDADLWIIYKDSLLEGNGGNLTTRLQLGVYKGEISFRPDLVFMPDKMITRGRQRFVPPAEARRERHLVLSTDLYDSGNPESFLSSVGENLKQAWEIAHAFPLPGQVTEWVMLPEFNLER